MQKKILLVDDQASIREYIAYSLQEAAEPYLIFQAENGQKAIEEAIRIKPDLIIMDWEMPVMNGIEAVKQIKNNPQTSDIPVIMETSLSSSKNLQIALEAGAVDYIRKPVDKIELIARIRSMLALSESYRKIKEQKEVIEQKNRQILHSIDYAQRIQKAVLPDIDKIKSDIPELFILLKPKDIVSGDFYWYAHTPASKENPQGKIIIAAVDCTGHGVPGAFMSMIGDSYLNQIVKLQHITTPNLILEQLHQDIQTALRQHETSNHDGMDISICAIDICHQTLEFAGARNPLVVIQNNELKIIKADLHGIGGARFAKQIKYTNHKIDLQKNNSFYIFSDGYYDQMGGENNTRFLSRRFYELLFTIHTLAIEEQKHTLKKSITHWMETGTNQGQMDDILVIGFKIDEAKTNIT